MHLTRNKISIGVYIFIIEIIGYIAALLTTVSLLPEIHKVWKAKHAEEISFYWLGSLSAGQVLWLAYGLAIMSIPLILSAAATLVIAAALIAIVIKDNKVRFRF
ncbi:MAG: PQ-loop domain-containing transporter [Candidatus Marsarchaeota archaeon]|nr:PQ-loop domain-containing transporter [Candidatus Marsarchaeota archaeon]